MKCSGLEDKMGRYTLGSTRLFQRWRAFQGLFNVDVVEMEGAGSGERSVAQKWSLILRRFLILFGVRVHESRKVCKSVGFMAPNWSRKLRKTEMGEVVVMFLCDVMEFLDSMELSRLREHERIYKMTDQCLEM